MASSELNEIRNAIDEFLNLLPLRLNWSVWVRENEVEVNVRGNDRSYLLTDHGRTILALQYLLGKILRHKVPRTVGKKIVVDSDGYLFQHESELRRLAQRTIRQVRRQGRWIKLPMMNPYERRIIHMEVAKNDDLSSRSSGDGFYKQVIVERRV